MRSVLSLALVFSVNACYVYVPVGDTMPAPGKEIRAYLSPHQDIDVGRVTVRDVERIDGIVYTSSGDTLAVFSNWLHQTFGRRFDSRRAVYYLTRDELGMLEERRIHPLRSLVSVALGVGAFASVFTFVADAGGGPGSGDGRTDTQQRLSRPFR
ncbi:MAG: hypothetical protein IID05_04720 [Gemmatimonadetes bacterium]|nr:hypothetical protein [Gemmatimonadota bacterium]